MTTMRSLMLPLALFAIAIAGCKHDTDLYCDQNTPCTPRYPDMPFCDLAGAYPASNSVAHTCIPDPRGDGGGQTCTGSGRTSMCPVSDPICVGGFCHECGASADCPVTQPVCGPSASCQACTRTSDCNGRPATPFCVSS